MIANNYIARNVITYSLERQQSRLFFIYYVERLANHSLGDISSFFRNARAKAEPCSYPTKYAPQYGGYCAMGVSLNKKLDTDPAAWRIVDNKLYLNLNKDVQKRWLEDVPGNIVIAEEVWPTIKLVSANVVNAE